jgi:hypothetical protein
MPKANPITVVHNFGGRRAPADGPTQVQTWGLWDCDPSKAGRTPSQCVTNSLLLRPEHLRLPGPAWPPACCGAGRYQ